jgi:hypothetical protein
MITLAGKTSLYKHQKDQNCCTDFIFYTKFRKQVGLEVTIDTSIRKVAGSLPQHTDFRGFPQLVEANSGNYHTESVVIQPKKYIK